MSYDPEPEKASRTSGVTWLLVLVALLVLGAGGVWLWQQYDPFFTHQPDMREASALLDAARKRPLSDEEFDRVIALLVSGTPAAQLSAIATIQAEVTRTPARRDRALAALEDCQKSASPEARQAARTAVTHLKAGQKEP